MYEAILHQLRATKDPAEKAAATAEFILNGETEKFALIARRCVVLHWFDLPVVKALSQDIALTDRKKVEIFERLAALPFIEQLAWGLTVQDLTRQGLIRHYAHSMPELLRTAAHLAAPSYEARGTDEKLIAEALYCHIIADEQKASHAMLHRLLNQAGDCEDWQFMSNLFSLKDEAEQLPSFHPIPLSEEQQFLRDLVYGLQRNIPAHLVGSQRDLVIEKTLWNMNRGTKYAYQKRYKKALIHFNKAIRYLPTFTPAYTAKEVVDARIRRSASNVVEQQEEISGAMRTLPYQWMKKNTTLLLNAGSLVGTTAVTGILGFAYWWLAARLFPPEAVGLASAAVSAMTLLGTFCVLGLGTLLIGELPRQPGKELSFISAALILVGGLGVCCGIVFALVAPLVSADFGAFGENPGIILLFAAGVGLTAITIVLDEALIGLLKGLIQLWRNALFSAAKLVFLILASLWLLNVGQIIFEAWVAGMLLSLLPLAGYVLLKKGKLSRTFKPDWHLLRQFKLLAFQHHLLNLILEAPTMAMPVLVTIVLSATTNAWFYIAWMISGLVFIASYALTTVLYAIKVDQPTELTHKLRLTLGLSLVTVILANCVLQLGAVQILGFFGYTYAQEAVLCLRFLSLAAFPMIIKYHYIAVSRINSKMVYAVLPVAIGGVLEVGIAVLGGRLDGLAGFSLGWVMAVSVEAIYMFPAVYKVMQPKEAAQLQISFRLREGRRIIPRLRSEIGSILLTSLRAVTSNDKDARRMKVLATGINTQIDMSE